MSAYDPNFETAVSADLWVGADPAAAMRATLALPYHVRFQGARTGLFSSAVLLATSDDARDSAITGLKRASEGFDHAQDILTDWACKARLHPEARAILADVIPSNPKAIDAIAAHADLVRRMLDALAEDRATSKDLFDELMYTAYTVFHPAMLDLEARMQAAGGERRARMDAAASDARARAMEARARIEGIARTVRLISLNARVEAARAGDTGRAFGVIAEEIKSLSEETEAVSAELGTSVDEIMANFRSF